MLSSFFGSSSSQFSYSTVKKTLEDKTFSLEDFLSKVTFELLTTVETAEEERGKTLLWLFARHTLNHPAYFVAIWHRFKNQITLTDILVSPLQGSQQGQTILWILVGACGLNITEPFHLVWEKFNQALDFRALTFPTAGGAGLSTIDLFFTVGFFGEMSIFEKLWIRFGEKFDAFSLSTQQKDGLHKGVNLWWFLAAFAFKGHLRFWDEIWQREGSNFFREIFAVRPDNPTQNNQTILWFLAFVAAKGQSDTFFEVWERIKRELTFADVTNPLSTADKVSLIRILLSFQTGRQIVLDILTQMPGIPNDSFLRELHQLSSEVAPIAQKILVAKKELYEHVEYLKKRKLLDINWTEQEINTLFNLAEEASLVGYVNAYYEIWIFLDGEKHPEKKSQAWSHIPPNSWFRTFSPEEEANFYIELSTKTHLPWLREIHLQTALYWAVRIRGNDKEKERSHLIQRVAAYLITGKNEYEPERPCLTPSLNTHLENAPFAELLNLFLVLKEQANYTRELEQERRSLLTMAPSARAEVARTETAAAAAASESVSLEAPLAALSLAAPPPKF